MRLDILGLVFLAGTLALGAAPETTVSLASITEVRGASPAEGELRITLRFEGAAAAGALDYDRVRISSARDDLGTSLQPPETAATGPGRLKRDGAAALLALLLQPAPRAARTISELSGSVILRGYRRQLVVIPSVRTLAGKAAEDPLFKAHGIEAFVTDPAQSQPGIPDAAEMERLREHAVSIRFSGQPQKILGVELLDAAGNLLPTRTTSFGGGRSVLFTASADRPLPADVRARVAIPTSPEDVEVPFSLKNIPLP